MENMIQRSTHLLTGIPLLQPFSPKVTTIVDSDTVVCPISHSVVDIELCFVCSNLVTTNLEETTPTITCRTHGIKVTIQVPRQH